MIKAILQSDFAKTTISDIVNKGLTSEYKLPTKNVLMDKNI